MICIIRSYIRIVIDSTSHVILCDCFLQESGDAAYLPPLVPWPPRKASATLSRGDAVDDIITLAVHQVIRKPHNQCIVQCKLYVVLYF